MQKQRSIQVNTISSWLLFAVISLLPFSYYPLVSFGSIYGTHLDGSLLYVATALTVTISLPVLWKQRRILRESTPLLWLGGFAIFSFISVLWSANPVRGAITAAFLALLTLLVSVVAIRLPTLKHRQQTIYRLFTATLGVSVIWALWQIYGDAFGVNNTYTLLAPAYESGVFGVARPTGFALEPQFFASLLLIPFFWLSAHIADARSASSRLHVMGLIVLSTILVLSLSRGALYAAGLGLVVLFALNHHHLKRWLILVGTLLGGTVVAAVILFSAASLNQRDTISGYQTLSKSLNHLSLGILSLPAETHEPQRQTTTSNASAQPKKTTGYVAESTDSRLSMSTQALSLWSENPQRLVFGVGSGGFGTTLHARDNRYPVSSIVNNYYLEVLVETGLIGFGLLATFFALLLYRLLKAKQTLLLVILASLLFQACFFSGNANIIHLWVIVGIAIGILLSQVKKPRHLVQ